jgi:hypothetical protein
MNQVTAIKSRSLPAQFGDLVQYIEWALPTERARNRKRLVSSMDEIRSFYDAMLARIEAALEYLNTFPLDDMPEAEQNLLNLTLMLAEVANAIELFKTQPGVIDGFDPERFITDHPGGGD